MVASSCTASRMALRCVAHHACLLHCTSKTLLSCPLPQAEERNAELAAQLAERKRQAQELIAKAQVGWLDNMAAQHSACGCMPTWQRLRSAAAVIVGFRGWHALVAARR